MDFRASSRPLSPRISSKALVFLSASTKTLAALMLISLSFCWNESRAWFAEA